MATDGDQNSIVGAANIRNDQLSQMLAGLMGRYPLWYPRFLGHCEPDTMASDQPSDHHQ